MPLLFFGAAVIVLIAYLWKVGDSPAILQEDYSGPADTERAYAPPVYQDPQQENQMPDNISVSVAGGGERNLIAFLSMIRYAEGTSGYFGYYKSFGGAYFLETDTHPSIRTYGEFVKAGQLDYTTAAGAYQITRTTWLRLTSKMGLSGFTPADQDAMAIELIREQGAYDDVIAGRFTQAVQKVSGVWASLPFSTVPQPKRTLAQVQAAYTDNGGSLA